MTSRFVMANIRMPIEIKNDNTIVPLQQLSNVYIDFIIDSINDINIDRTLPDIVTQTNRLFQERAQPQSTNIPQQVSIYNQPDQAGTNIQINSITTPENKIGLHNSPSGNSNTHHMWIRPDELRKTPPQFKRNTSFKNRGKYSHRTTVKTRTT